MSDTIGKPFVQGLRELEEREAELGWRLLLNESVTLHRGDDSLTVVGVENWSPQSFFPSTGDLAKASSGTEGSSRILLTHDPIGDPLRCHAWDGRSLPAMTGKRRV